MIRERRNKEKLALYYKKFMEEGIKYSCAVLWGRTKRFIYKAL